MFVFYRSATTTTDARFSSDDILIIIMLWSYGFNGATMCKIFTKVPFVLVQPPQLPHSKFIMIASPKRDNSTYRVWLESTKPKRALSHSFAFTFVSSIFLTLRNYDSQHCIAASLYSFAFMLLLLCMFSSIECKSDAKIDMENMPMIKTEMKRKNPGSIQITKSNGSSDSMKSTQHTMLSAFEIQFSQPTSADGVECIPRIKLVDAENHNNFAGNRSKWIAERKGERRELFNSYAFVNG